VKYKGIVIPEGRGNRTVIRTPGAISTKLSTHMSICMCKVYIYITLYINIDICVPSLVEIAPGVPEICLSGVI
jgi:hypothetical protein